LTGKRNGSRGYENNQVVAERSEVAQGLWKIVFDSTRSICYIATLKWTFRGALMGLSRGCFGLTQPAKRALAASIKHFIRGGQRIVNDEIGHL